MDRLSIVPRLNILNLSFSLSLSPISLKLADWYEATNEIVYGPSSSRPSSARRMRG